MDILIIKSFFLKYLLLPLLAIILVVVLGYVKKKSAVIKNKTLIVYILVAALCLALPGFLGFSGNMFNPYWYLLAVIIYLFLGVLHVNLMDRYFKHPDKSNAYIILFKCLVTLICMLLGAYLFVYAFMWLSPYDGYAYMAATGMLIFIVPLSFYYCYLQFMNIPFDIYKTWQHTPGQKPVDFEGIDYNKLMVVNLELTKNIEDGNRFRIKAKSLSKGISFGDWFYRVIDDYNHRNPNNGIQLLNDEQDPYSWIFYTKKSIFHFRRFIDFEYDISDNGINENDTVICKRVMQNEVKEENVIVLK